MPSESGSPCPRCGAAMKYGRWGDRGGPFDQVSIGYRCTSCEARDAAAYSSYQMSKSLEEDRQRRRIRLLRIGMVIALVALTGLLVWLSVAQLPGLPWLQLLLLLAGEVAGVALLALAGWWLWRKHKQRQEVWKLIHTLTDDPSSLRRYHAAMDLARLGRAAAPAIPALIRALRLKATDNSTGSLQVYALEALGNIGRPARAAVPVVVEHLKMNRAYACSALRKLLCPAAVPGLAEILRTGSDATLLSMAAGFLGDLGRRAAAAVPELLLLLANPDADVRAATARALALIRRDYRPALDQLGPNVIKHGQGLAGLLEFARFSGDSDSVAAALALVVGNPKANSKEAVEACRLLEKMGPKAKAAVPALSQALTNHKLDYATKRKVSDWALEALRKIAPEKCPAQGPPGGA